jgi:hypothetical protein
VSTLYTPISASIVTGYGTPDTFATVYNGGIYGDDLSANAGQWAQAFVTRLDTFVDTMAAMRFGTNASFSTVATAGITLTTMAANAAATFDIKIIGGKTNFAILEGGNADAVGGATAAQIATRMQALCTPRHGAGWTKVILVGLLPSSGNAAVNAATNALFKAGYVGWGVDAYVDVLADPVFGSANVYANALYYNPDQLTLNLNGVTRYNDLVLQQVKAALGL